MKVCIFCGSRAGIDPDIEGWVKKVMGDFAEKGIELVYGGASIGIMGMLANELMIRGGVVTGVIPQHLLNMEVAHAGLSKLHIVADMHERKQMMYKLSDAFLVFPGGLGTLEELFEIVTWRQLGLHQKPIAILNINGFYDQLLSFLDHTVDQGFVSQEHRNLIFSSSSWEDIVKHFSGVINGER